MNSSAVGEMEVSTLAAEYIGGDAHPPRRPAVEFAVLRDLMVKPKPYLQRQHPGSREGGGEVRETEQEKGRQLARIVRRLTCLNASDLLHLRTIRHNVQVIRNGGDGVEEDVNEPGHSRWYSNDGAPTEEYKPLIFGAKPRKLLPLERGPEFPFLARNLVAGCTHWQTHEERLRRWDEEKHMQHRREHGYYESIVGDDMDCYDGENDKEENKENACTPAYRLFDNAPACYSQLMSEDNSIAEDGFNGFNESIGWEDDEVSMEGTVIDEGLMPLPACFANTSPTRAPLEERRANAESCMPFSTNPTLRSLALIASDFHLPSEWHNEQEMGGMAPAAVKQSKLGMRKKSPDGGNSALSKSSNASELDGDGPVKDSLLRSFYTIYHIGKTVRKDLTPSEKYSNIEELARSKLVNHSMKHPPGPGFPSLSRGLFIHADQPGAPGGAGLAPRRRPISRGLIMALERWRQAQLPSLLSSMETEADYEAMESRPVFNESALELWNRRVATQLGIPAPTETLDRVTEGSSGDVKQGQAKPKSTPAGAAKKQQKKRSLLPAPVKREPLDPCESLSMKEESASSQQQSDVVCVLQKQLRQAAKEEEQLLGQKGKKRRKKEKAPPRPRVKKEPVEIGVEDSVGNEGGQQLYKRRSLRLQGIPPIIWLY